jgi:outer membrane lipoprotein-sorting protein
LRSDPVRFWFSPCVRGAPAVNTGMLLKPSAKALLIILLALTLTPASRAGELLPGVIQWLDAQAGIHTWSADFVQTRHLRTLTQPLTATGRVWYASPNQFRWELGQPPKTVALRSSNEMVLIYPALKRAERYSLQAQSGPWKDASALLEAGFPRSRGQMEKQFEVLSQAVTNGAIELQLRPRSAATRRMMPRISIGFDPSNQKLLSTELEFGDGSRMRNDFSNQEVNHSLPESVFSTILPEDFKVVEPAKAAR